MSTTPNLLFLFPDQWRWDWFGYLSASDSPYGDVPIRTPNIDALAARGTRFTQCRTNSPLCNPARACLTSGMRYHNCPVKKNGQQLDAANTDTIFRHLRDAGYRTSCCGKTDLIAHGLPIGTDGWCRDIGAFGFTHSANQGGKGNAINIGRDTPNDLWGQTMLEQGRWRTIIDDWDLRGPGRKGRDIPTHPCPMPNYAHSDGFTATRALKFLSDWPVDPSAPWMMWVNFPGPHEPFDPPADVAGLYDGIDFPEPFMPLGPEDGNDHPAIRRAYAALATNIDTWIGRIIASLEQRGELDRTLIIFSSDHGEMLGDHGRWWKSVPHEPSVRIPLVLAGPDVQQGAVRDELVELIDIGATLLAAAGLEPMPNVDARPLPTHGGAARDVTLSGLEPWSMITDGQYKFATDFEGEDWLVNLATDPRESRNLASEQPETADRLRNRLQQETATPAAS